MAGDVVVWEPLDFDGEVHAHIGFAISQEEAISNSSKTKTPQKHSILKNSDNQKPHSILGCYRFDFEKIKHL